MDILKRLASWLDRPLFPWKKLITSFSIAQFLIDNYLSYRQYKVLQRTVVPKALAAEVDQATFDKSQKYGRAKAEFGFVSGAFNQVLELAILYSDVYPKLWNLTGIWISSYFPARFSGEITHSLVFVFTYAFAQTVINLPFSYYHHFVLEEAYGFNKQTLKLWVTDIVKGQALGLALGAPIGAAFLSIIKWAGEGFFYYLWLFAVGTQAILITIYPSLIMPIFNKFTPLDPGPLRESVEALATKLKFPLTELEVMDGSTRSAHSNAFFTGLPWKKKIVLFDTLIEKSEKDEVVAVLAHELGHWKMSHTTKQLAIAQGHLFVMFALFSAFIHNRSLYVDFGFYKEQPIIIGFMLFSEILGPTESIIGLLMNVLSRKFEFEADAFGAQMGYSAELARSLIKLQIQNLSAMDADWMYSAYHYSHPILTERLRALGYKSEQKVAPDANGDAAVKASGREL